MGPRLLLVVLAGGAGGRLELLTENRAKPAVPYAGHYRLIDVPLSNALHSGISDVWVLQQHNPVSLSDHLANGRPWDLDRTHGGLLVLHPHLGTDKEGWHEGTADALWRQAELIREFAPDALVVVSADAVYRLDYAEVAAAHLASDATVTMVTTRVGREEASRYGVVEGDGERVSRYDYKPDEPATDVVATEVFVFTPGPTLDLLEQLASEAGDDGLEDLGDDLLPRLAADGAARQFRLEGYWRDLGTVDAYWDAHMQLVHAEPPFRPDDPEWPLVTQAGRQGPARLLPAAEVMDSLLSGGCRIAGRVRRSVLSPGVVVEDGATVVDSVLLHDVTIRSGAYVERAILDSGTILEAGQRVGGSNDVTLIGPES